MMSAPIQSARGTHREPPSDSGASLNLSDYLPAAGLGALSMGILMLVIGLVRLHRRRRREFTREDLQELAHSRGLYSMEGRIPVTLEEIARAVGGQGRHGGLSGVLRGQDQQGSWYLCRRRHQGRLEQALLFENKFLTVKDLKIVPVRGVPKRQWNPLWWRRSRASEPLRLDLLWESAVDRVDERSVRITQALYLLMAQARKVVEPLGLHLQVNDQRVAVHTRGPLDGDALRVFLDVALELRRQVIDVPRVCGALRLSPGQSGQVRPIEGEVTKALKVAGHPNEFSGPTVPYGAMLTGPRAPSQASEPAAPSQASGPAAPSQASGPAAPSQASEPAAPSRASGPATPSQASGSHLPSRAS